MTVLPSLEQLLGDAAERLTPAIVVVSAGGGAPSSSRAGVRGLLGALRRRSRRWRPLALIVVLVLGGATAALAAAGVFQTGTPVGANVPANPRVQDGLAISSSVQLLPLSVSDPRGGPAWGLRYMRTTRGLACLQYGRVVGGKIGALGQDDAFSNDGRFHSFSVNYEQEGPGMGCSELDTRGHAVFNAIIQKTSASAIDGSCSPTKPSPPPPGFHSTGPVKLCPARDLRDVYYGLLGPDATSISYTTPAGQLVTERTAGADGAYLIVGLPTTERCTGVKIGRILIHPCFSGNTSNPALQSYGVIRSVAYRNGHTCRLSNLLSSCPPVGYRTVPVQHFTLSEVRAPISVHTSFGWRFCWKGPGRVVRPCRGTLPPAYRLTPAFHGRVNSDPPGGRLQVRAFITFTSRVAITNIDSAYVISWRLTPSPGEADNHADCQVGDLDGAGMATREDLRAGQRVTEQIFADQQCHGTMHGSIKLTTAKGPETNLGFIGPQGNGILVGTFSFPVP